MAEWLVKFYCKLRTVPVKQILLDGAEVMDAYRVFPRFFVVYFMWEAAITSIWFRSLEAPTPEQVAYVSALWVASAGVTKFYVESGRKWGPQ